MAIDIFYYLLWQYNYYFLLFQEKTKQRSSILIFLKDSSIITILIKNKIVFIFIF
jgi:hypothetical protein